MPLFKDFSGFKTDMSGIDYDLIAAHGGCLRNRKMLSEAGRGACFYCCAEFRSEEIVEWCDDGETALFPRCGIDSVLMVAGRSVDPEFLRRMHEYWFSRTAPR